MINFIATILSAPSPVLDAVTMKEIQKFIKSIIII